MLKKLGTIRVLVFKQGENSFLAQGLEHDIAVQGRSLKEVQDAFKFCYAGHIALAAQDGKTTLDIPRAPACYWDLFHKDNRLPASAVPKPKAGKVIKRSPVAEFALA